MPKQIKAPDNKINESNISGITIAARKEGVLFVSTIFWPFIVLESQCVVSVFRVCAVVVVIVVWWRLLLVLFSYFVFHLQSLLITI